VTLDSGSESVDAPGAGQSSNSAFSPLKIRVFRNIWIANLVSNAGTWMIGRLQTERDKARIIEALRSASGEVDVGAWDARISGLGKRQFVLKTARSAQPSLFTTRWAMSYLTSK